MSRDFAWFRLDPERSAQRVTAAEADMTVTLHQLQPPYADLPAVSAGVVTPRNVSFRDGRTSYVDYFGRGLAIVDDDERTCIIYSPDFDLLREIAYLFVLSTVGQHLDRRHLHRIHAMGVAYRGKGILLLLPSGGGKSTMTMELLRRPGITLLSEDTPLIDRAGRIHPFPLRLGVKNASAAGVPEQYQRTLERMEFDPKTFVDLAFFESQLSDSVGASLLLVGERNLGAESAIVPLGRGATLEALVKYLVVGLGVYQGLEFLLERGLWEMAGKTGVAASRMRNGLALMSKTDSYRFILGRDTALNSRTLATFIETRFS